MKTALSSGIGAFALAVAAFAGNAEAQCLWTGYAWSCAAPPAYTQSYGGAYQDPAYGGGYQYPAYGGGYQYPAYPYGSNYGDGYTGYKPAWLPSYPGPKLSGGSGH